MAVQVHKLFSTILKSKVQLIKKKKKKRFITALVKTTDLNGEEAIYSPSLPSPSVGGGATELQSP